MRRKSESEIVVIKIPLEVLIQNLINVFNSGMDYVDIIVTSTPFQDHIGIVIREEYFSQEEREIKKLSDEDLNELMES